MQKYFRMTVIASLFLSPTISYAQPTTIENTGNSTVTINGKQYTNNGNQKIRVKSDGSIVHEGETKKSTNKNTLSLECLINEDIFNIVLAKQNNNSESPLVIYKNSQKFQTFSKYKTSELAYSAYSQLKIGNQKLVANKADIDRLTGEVVISQKVLSVFGGASKSKRYNTFMLRGICNKSAVKPLPQRF